MTTELRHPTRDAETTNKEMMRAIVQHTYGPSETLALTEVARPEPGPGEVLIEVYAAGMDRGVWHLMTGLPYVVRLAGYGISRPKHPIPGMDVAGRVVTVGEGVKRFDVGDAVFGIARGAYAEFAIAEEAKLAHKPDSMTFDQAGVAAISGITALQALTDVGRLEAGQDVLVIGASGGVGSYAVQLSKALGATVTGVASGTKTDLVLTLGADEAIDYTADDYLDGRKRYDLIIDTGGRNPVRKLRRALRRDGTLVIVGGEGGNRLTGGIGRQLRAVALSPFVSQRLAMFVSSEDHRHIERLARHLDTDEVTPAIGERFSLDDVPEAIRKLEAGEARGKSVVVIHRGTPDAT